MYDNSFAPAWGRSSCHGNEHHGIALVQTCQFQAIRILYRRPGVTVPKGLAPSCTIRPWTGLGRIFERCLRNHQPQKNTGVQRLHWCPASTFACSMFWRVWFGVWFEEMQHACGHNFCIRHFWNSVRYFYIDLTGRILEPCLRDHRRALVSRVCKKSGQFLRTDKIGYFRASNSRSALGLASGEALRTTNIQSITTKCRQRLSLGRLLGRPCPRRHALGMMSLAGSVRGPCEQRTYTQKQSRNILIRIFTPQGVSFFEEKGCKLMDQI